MLSDEAFASLRAKVPEWLRQMVIFPRRPVPRLQRMSFLLSAGFTRQQVESLSEEEVQAFVWLYTDDRSTASIGDPTPGLRSAIDPLEWATRRGHSSFSPALVQIAILEQLEAMRALFAAYIGLQQAAPTPPEHDDKVTETLPGGSVVSTYFSDGKNVGCTLELPR